MKNYGRGERWLPGEIAETMGPLLFKVKMQDGRVIRCHLDHIRNRPGVTHSQDSGVLADDDMEGPTVTVETEPPEQLLPQVDDFETNATETTPPVVDTDTSTVSSGQPVGRKYPSRNRSPPDWYRS